MQTISQDRLLLQENQATSSAQGVTRYPEYDLRHAFSGQAHLLALRAEAGLSIDIRSVINLLRVYRQLMLEEAP